MPAIRILFATCFVLLLVPPAAAYPIKPAPLWDLTARAKLIVIAKVIEVVELPPPNYPEEVDSHLARLEVLETLKGDDVAYLKIPFPGNFACPAPPDYRAGETVVAFLERGENQELRTVSLSYGTLYPRGDDHLEDVKSMVKSAQVLQRACFNEGARASHKRAWLLEAAVRPGTRWHGLFEIEPRSERMRKYSGYPEQTIGIKIRPYEQPLLAEAFLVEDRPHPTLEMLLQVLDGHDDKRVDSAALRWIEGLLALDDPPWWTRTLMVTALLRMGDADPRARMSAQNPKTWELTDQQLRRIWSQAKKELGLPTLPSQKIDDEDL